MLEIADCLDVLHECTKVGVYQQFGNVSFVLAIALLKNRIYMSLMYYTALSDSMHISEIDLLLALFYALLQVR